MHILMVGDIVGSPGRRLFKDLVPALRDTGRADLVIANAENAAGGRGLTPALADELFAAGADLLTLGDHAWDCKELIPHIEQEPRILRPANFAPGCPGRGMHTIDSAHGPVTMINLVGRVFMPPAECPFLACDRLLEPMGPRNHVILVDMHAEATSEKIAMGIHIEGRVTAVVGSHTHVQTADEQLRPRETAYITDLGMTGPLDSILGRDKTAVLQRFVTGMPARFGVARGHATLQGVIIAAASDGRALGIERINRCEAS